MFRIAAVALFVSLIALPVSAQSNPDLTSIAGPCSGAQLQSLPYLSVQGSSLSAVTFTNPSADTIANVQACGYDQQGNFLGGTSFALVPNQWFIAASSTANQWASLSQLFGGASLPTGSSFNAVITSDIAVQLQGIVNNPALGARVIVQSGATPGTVIASNALGMETLDQGYLFIADPTQAAAIASIDLLYGDGTVVTGLGPLSIPAFGSAVASIGDLLTASGATGGQGLFSVRATDTASGSKVAALSLLATLSESGGPYGVTLPLQVVTP